MMLLLVDHLLVHITLIDHIILILKGVIRHLNSIIMIVVGRRKERRREK